MARGEPPDQLELRAPLLPAEPVRRRLGSDRCIVAARRSLSGQLFGDRDGWATQPDMSFQTRQDAEAMLLGLGVEQFNEVEEDGKTAVGDPKHWHLFHVVARKQ